MATRRVLIDATASSPLRVAAGGVDASGADFDNLVFDANQAPLRIFLNGWMSMPYNSPSVIVSWGQGPNYGPAPSGTFPLFLVTWYQPNSSLPGTDGVWIKGQSPFGTTSGVAGSNLGAGGCVSGGNFKGLNYCRSVLLPNGSVNPPGTENTRVGYAIFNNYQPG